ncbi:dipeptidyl-peptidase 9 [Clonorchis sinensis]|uniref:Dipeptidyl-peptidase 9 n=1 Tax=Clonorchis sinensis TaxID=79923 RepID=G7YRI3_CLOSI|nr:dipeptidyl-peptidase 9 [Clonorchis sinensis]
MDSRNQASPASPRESSAWTSDEDLAAQRLRSPYKLSPVDRPSSTFGVGQSTLGPYTFADFYHAASCVKFNKKHYLIPTAVSLRTSRCEPSDQTQPSCRVYFICYPRSEDITRFIPTLFCCDVSLSSPTDVELPWFHLLPDDFTMDNAPISLAESLLRERMRATSSGVADFEVESSGHLVITASSRIFFATDTAEINQSTEVVKPIEAPVMAPLQPKLCPTNPDLIACVAFGQLTIGHSPSNTWVPQTYFETDKGISVAMPPYVVQEEFDRYVGFWWRPTPLAVSADSSTTYQILYELVDERPVELVHLLAGQVVESHRYPKAGCANAISDLRVCQFDLSAEGEIGNVRHLCLPRPLLQYLPGFEYIVRAGWTPDGQYVWCQMLTRLQDSLQIFLIPTSNFHETHLRDNPSDDGEAMEPFHRVSLPCIRLLCEEDVQYWVQVHDYFELLTHPWHPVHPATTSASPDRAETTTTEAQQAHMTFVWASHRSGHLHLYLMQRTWPKSAVLCANSRTNYGVAEIIDAQELFTSQLTNGLWEVTGDRLWLDEHRQLVFFEANREHPLLRHIYAVSYASGTRGKLTRLTPLKSDAQFGDVHSSPCYGTPTDEEACYDPHFPVSGTTPYPLSFKLSAFDPASGWAVVSSSSLNRTTGVQVVKIHHNLAESSAGAKNLAMTHVAWLRHHIPHEQVLPNQLRPCDPPRVVRFDIEHQPNPSGTIDESAGFSDSPVAKPPQQSSTYLYGLLFTPKQSKPAGGYPTVHFVYGGPGVQLVLGTYAKVTLMHALVYCHFGYAVFLCDCRGSSNRGIQFAGYLKNQLGLPELDDHVAFLKHVAQKTGLIDLSRVAITGNSYGGYMSLMAAMRYSDVYRASVAGSPVVDWTLYDTAYTERYMGLPRDNPIGYWNGNVLRYVEQLPADEVRLIICHGALDENVHFVHTSRLVHKLESSGKPFKLLYYPTSRHGIKEYEHMEASLLQLFEKVLKPRDSTGSTV